MVSVPMPDLRPLIDLADRFGLIDAVKNKLQRQPDPAAEKLATALNEIRKIFAALDAELSRYLGLSLDETQPRELLDNERRILITLEGGEVRARMAEARGHCSKIKNIYDRYLTPWFDRILSRNEADQLMELFRAMDEFDSQMVVTIDQLAEWLTSEAEQTATLFDRGDIAGANARVRSARSELLPARRAIADATRKLFELEATFIEVSGAI